MHDSMSNEVPILKKQILLVEDETVFANAVKKHLSRKGYEIYLASDLKSANLHLKENIPDIYHNGDLKHGIVGNLNISFAY